MIIFFIITLFNSPQKTYLQNLYPFHYRRLNNNNDNNNNDNDNSNRHKQF